MVPFTDIGRLEKDEGSGVAWICIKRALSFGSQESISMKSKGSSSDAVNRRRGLGIGLARRSTSHLDINGSIGQLGKCLIKYINCSSFYPKFFCRCFRVFFLLRLKNPTYVCHIYYKLFSLVYHLSFLFLRVFITSKCLQALLLLESLWPSVMQ